MQVDDQLELVHRLEVRELGLVARLDQRLERHLHERARRRRRARDCSPNRSVSVSSAKVVSRTPARVLPEAVGIGEDAGAGACRWRPGGRRRARARRRRTGRRCAGDGPGPWARPSRRRCSRAGTIAPEVDVEAVGEQEQRARLEVRRDLVVVDRLRGRVGHRDHDHVGPADGLTRVEDLEARLLREGPALAVRAAARR